MGAELSKAARGGTFKGFPAELNKGSEERLTINRTEFGAQARSQLKINLMDF